MNAELLLAFAETMKDVLSVNEQLDGRVTQLNKHITGRVEGVSVESEPITNDDV
jgi:glycine cleavage system H lipoate-binding protein